MEMDWGHIMQLTIWFKIHGMVDSMNQSYCGMMEKIPRKNEIFLIPVD